MLLPLLPLAPALAPALPGIFTAAQTFTMSAQLLMAMGTLSSWGGQFHEKGP